ncbi:PHD finger protein ALFIN-LIKE 5 isoform X5 [Dendrobium catenatum]|uniref:PHD finger protein ALFIN-LIKE 5 isoform X5 n=1 Tax=Dendrobium catenatum TaxID=906689 RepID=UPI0009F56119|nr:PHD finger protein ALFIN-LIKE 5 isoform X5 [Dendrobium catenatum]
MDGGAPQYNPRTVEEVFGDYKARRAALIKALTTDVDEFFQQCDPEKENLCLYGHPNEQWEVNLPAEEVPPEIPEPALGINFARDGMQEKDWLALVAVHSDAWLLAVAFYFGARFGFDKVGRNHLSFSPSTQMKIIPRKRRKVWLKMIMAKLYAVHVERTTQQMLMNFGSAAMSVRSGSMEIVSRSHQRGPNTSNNTSAPHAAATRDLGPPDAEMTNRQVFFFFPSCIIVAFFILCKGDCRLALFSLWL